ncbi:MAG: nucleotidyl transferase AbiEii/AbiGii toxin family protein [Deltaproteobacteria bacterium]|nr:nucleotidyl transferase AbiEii/AbiGii toxin family protein [Deltaproteobacteria bacterium]
MKDTIYYRQAELLLKVLPIVDAEGIFALKGGTAINFFVRDLPRLSVDIDLAYIPIGERNESLQHITVSLNNISLKILKMFPNARIAKMTIGDTSNLRGMVVSVNGVTIKIEPNIVMRGTVYEPKNFELSQKAQEFFELYVSVKSLTSSELYASKICAALDRQHPRDLFDIYLLLKNEKIGEKMRRAFIIYLICHPRPMVELLYPNLKDISENYEKEFKGMTIDEILLEDLLEARDSLISTIKNTLTRSEKDFLLSVKKGNPDWSIMEMEGIESLPAVKWKLLNIGRMDKAKHHIAIEKLEKYLE